MISSCETEKYAHNIVNANISLARSWKFSAVATFDIGANFTSDARTMIVKASVDRPWPPRVRTPKIVEYQCGSSDITQSTLMKVIVSTHRHKPGAETRRKRRSCGPGSSVGFSSCWRDHFVRIQVRADQMPKYSAARI